MKQVSDSRWATLVLAIACIGLASQTVAAEPNPFDQSVKPLQVGELPPAIPFVDQHGHRVTFGSLQGQTVLVGFIYTRCLDACPIITQKFARLDRLLGPGSYSLVEVTIEPAHDTQPVIAAYAKKYGMSSARWHILTGDTRTLETFARSAGLAVIDNGRGELVHNARLLILSPDGRLADVVELVAWDPATVAAQLQHVAGKASSPLARANFALTKSIAQFCGGSYQVASGIIDVVAALLIIAAGVSVLLWMRRRIFAQGA